MAIKLSEIIAPAYSDFHKAVLSGEYDHFWAYGGRACCKSSTISAEIVMHLWGNPQRNALVLRRNANTILGSVFNQMLWALEKLDVLHLTEVRKNPPLMYFPSTGQQIIFRGLDDAQKIKSIKPKTGYISCTWFEEVTEVEPEQIRSVLQSTMRGGNEFRNFYSYNPSPFVSNWVNNEMTTSRPRTFRKFCSYLDVPKTWLGEAFFREAEILREKNERAFKNEYLGEVTGGGGQVFSNLEVRPITQQEISLNTDKFSIGIDWGFAISPLVIVVVSYNKTRKEIRIVDEFFGHNIPNDKCAEKLKQFRALYPSSTFFADCAEPKSIDFMKRLGIPVSPCVKGADSIRFGVHWLQDLTAIIVDPSRCPKCAEQFTNYEYQKNRVGDWIDDYPPKNDDSIDAVRYASTYWANLKPSLFS